MHFILFFREPTVGMSEQERGSIHEVIDTVKAHGKTMEAFQEDHSCQAASIKEKAQETFQQRFMVC